MLTFYIHVKHKQYTRTNAFSAAQYNYSLLCCLFIFTQRTVFYKMSAKQFVLTNFSRSNSVFGWQTREMRKGKASARLQGF